MAIVDIYSKRQKTLRGEVYDVYSYDDIPQPLKVQIIQILYNTIGKYDKNSIFHNSRANNGYKYIVETLCHEYGVFSLSSSKNANKGIYIEELTHFFLQEQNVERVLDAVELSFQKIDSKISDFVSPEESNAAIEELNVRFKEHGIGYEYLDGKIIRIDSEFIHSEAVKPALRLLQQKEYAGAQEEFLEAYEHYRLANSKEALNKCLNAFESVMKAICEKRKWSYDKNDTSKKLIEICLEKGLIPQFWQLQYTSLRNLLESSIPTGRNRMSGHGQGTSPQVVPDYIVAYMLHMTASAIVFLAEAEKNLP